MKELCFRTLEIALNQEASTVVLPFLINKIRSITVNVVRFYPDSKYNYVEHSTNSTYVRSKYCRDKGMSESGPLIIMQKNISPNECIIY
jgi:hypothetical protein